MARKSKFEEEKNRLAAVRKIVDEAIKDIEGVQRSCGANGEYERALIYQACAKELKTIRIACGEENPKEVA